MKTNRSARWIVRIRVSLLCLAIPAIAAVEVGVGESLAARIGQTGARQTASQQVWNPNLGISDLMAAAAR